jgi:hypothetical protein
VPQRRSLHLLGTNDGSCLSRRYGVCGEGRGAAVVETRKEGPSVAATFRQLAPSTFRGKEPGKPIPCSPCVRDLSEAHDPKPPLPTHPALTRLVVGR